MMLVTEKSGGLGGVVCLCVCVGGGERKMTKNLGDEKNIFSFSLCWSRSLVSLLSLLLLSPLSRSSLFLSFLSLSLVP